MRPRRTSVAGGDVEFLADLGAEHAGEMVGVGADQGGVVSGDFVGDPAAAGHAENNLNHKGHKGTQRNANGLAAPGIYPKMSFTLPIRVRRCGLFST